MEKVKIVFKKCIQDSQEYGSNDEFMVSRIFFDIITPTENYKDLHSDIKQMVGGKFDSDPIEVSLPTQLKEKLDYGSFRNVTEDYYRNLVGFYS